MSNSTKLDSERVANEIFRYWGKADETGRYHLLPYHCLDVAAVAACWWTENVPLRRRLCYAIGMDVEISLAWILFFIALHDLGKFDIRFQFKAPAALAKVWPDFTVDQADPEPGFSHGPAGLYWFRKELGSRLSDTQLDRWLPWVQAVAGHHGNLSPHGKSGEIGRPNADEAILAADRDARRAWIETLAELFLAPAGLGLDDLPPPCPELVAGFCSVSDWLGSNEEHFTYRSDPVPLPEYWVDIQGKAAQALAESGLFQPPLFQGGMTALFPDLAPRQVQTLVDRLPASPGLTLIEAPTGSGKTEAALAYAARLLAAGHADAVVFALPTQATANAMFERLERIAPRLFPGGANLLLAHGKAEYYNRNFQALKAATRPTAQGGEEALAQCVAWLGASRKRALLGQIGVCTIDQVLLSVLPVRHQFVRAFGVRKAVLIVDEVHAYDAYMYGLLHRVLEGQSRAGGSALLLSATLPAHQKAQLRKAWDASADLAEANPYPLVTHIADRRAALYELGEAESPSPSSVTLSTWHAPDLLPDDARCEAIIAAAQAGALVGIVCNLVNDAQGLAERLRQRIDELAGTIPVDLFHARFCFADRMAREEEVIARYGKKAPRGQGRILVATQVIEQSLDLDFDWLITQLCPVDLLFQRLGRLHRHEWEDLEQTKRRSRPQGFESARCTVLLPLAEGEAMPDYGLHGVVYGYLRVLWRTQRMVEGHAVIEFPAAYREWIEAVYRESPQPQEPKAVTGTAERFFKEQEGRFYAARQFSVTTATPLADTDGNAAKLTRDGEMSLPVVLLQETREKTLLDGRRLNAIDEAERDEALDGNTVHVPNSWHTWLPKADEDGLRWLKMRKNADGWWEGADGLLYHEKVGLVRR